MKKIVTHFMLLVAFETPWKYEKFLGFVMFSEWLKMTSGMTCVKEIFNVDTSKVSKCPRYLQKLSEETLSYPRIFMWNSNNVLANGNFLDQLKWPDVKLIYKIATKETIFMSVAWVTSPKSLVDVFSVNLTSILIRFF